MHVVRDKTEVREAVRVVRTAGQTLALVPTMGALHDGHMSLVKAAREIADHVSVSIFVNPTQFGPAEDLHRYPADLDGDLRKLEKAGVDLVFTPSTEEMYPERESTWVHVEVADRHLCGRFRPGHFRGVTTVVATLFNIFEPDKAVFGLKDAQQVLIVRKMVRDLAFGVEIVGHPTVRESDGLALSSRNAYLTEEQRTEAVVVSSSVFGARDMILAGERDPAHIAAAMKEEIGSVPSARLQYAEVVDTATIAPVDKIKPGDSLLVATAVFFGNTRLIDNQFVIAP